MEILDLVLKLKFASNRDTSYLKLKISSKLLDKVIELIGKRVGSSVEKIGK